MPGSRRNSSLSFRVSLAVVLMVFQTGPSRVLAAAPADRIHMQQPVAGAVNLPGPDQQDAHEQQQQQSHNTERSSVRSWKAARSSGSVHMQAQPSTQHQASGSVMPEEPNHKNDKIIMTQQQQQAPSQPKQQSFRSWKAARQYEAARQGSTAAPDNLQQSPQSASDKDTATDQDQHMHSSALHLMEPSSTAAGNTAAVLTQAVAAVAVSAASKEQVVPAKKEADVDQSPHAILHELGISGAHSQESMAFDTVTAHRASVPGHGSSHTHSSQQQRIANIHGIGGSAGDVLKPSTQPGDVFQRDTHDTGRTSQASSGGGGSGGGSRSSAGNVFLVIAIGYISYGLLRSWLAPTKHNSSSSMDHATPKEGRASLNVASKSTTQATTSERQHGSLISTTGESDIRKSLSLESEAKAQVRVDTSFTGHVSSPGEISEVSMMPAVSECDVVEAAATTTTTTARQRCSIHELAGPQNDAQSQLSSSEDAAGSSSKQLNTSEDCSSKQDGGCADTGQQAGTSCGAQLTAAQAAAVATHSGQPSATAIAEDHHNGETAPQKEPCSWSEGEHHHTGTIRTTGTASSCSRTSHKDCRGDSGHADNNHEYTSPPVDSFGPQIPHTSTSFHAAPFQMSTAHSIASSQRQVVLVQPHPQGIMLHIGPEALDKLTAAIEVALRPITDLTHAVQAGVHVMQSLTGHVARGTQALHKVSQQMDAAARAAQLARQQALCARCVQLGCVIMTGCLVAQSFRHGRLATMFLECGPHSTHPTTHDAHHHQQQQRQQSMWGRTLSAVGWSHSVKMMTSSWLGGGGGGGGMFASVWSWWRATSCYIQQMSTFSLGMAAVYFCLPLLYGLGRQLPATWQLDIPLLMAGLGSVTGMTVVSWLGGCWTVWLLCWWTWCATAWYMCSSVASSRLATLMTAVSAVLVLPVLAGWLPYHPSVVPVHVVLSRCVMSCVPDSMLGMVHLLLPGH